MVRPGHDVGGVAVWAHVGGFVAGMIMVKLFGERSERISVRVSMIEAIRVGPRNQIPRALALERPDAGQDYYHLHGCVGRKQDCC